MITSQSLVLLLLASLATQADAPVHIDRRGHGPSIGIVKGDVDVVSHALVDGAVGCRGRGPSTNGSHSQTMLSSRLQSVGELRQQILKWMPMTPLEIVTIFNFASRCLELRNITVHSISFWGEITKGLGKTYGRLKIDKSRR